MKNFYSINKSNIAYTKTLIRHLIKVVLSFVYLPLDKRKKNPVFIFIICFSLVVGLSNLNAANKTWIGASGGNWGTAGNWSPSGIPAAVDDVIIPTGYSVSVNVVASCASLTIQGGATSNAITLNSASLTVSGAINIGAGTATSANKSIAVGTRILSCGSINIDPIWSTDRYSAINISTGTVNVSGNFTIGDVNGDIVFSGAGTLNVGGSLSGGTFTASSGTVNYNGTNQTVGTYTYNNLTLSGSGAKTLAANVSINGNLTISSGVTFDLATYTANRTAAGGGTLTVAGTMKLGGGTGGQSGSNFPTNFQTTTLTGGTVNYNRSWGQQAVYAGVTYNNLTLENTSNAQTVSNNLTVNGTLTTTAGGILNMGTYRLTTAAVNHSGTLQTQNTTTTPFSAGLTWGGTVLFDGASAQTIPNSTFNNLTLSNSNSSLGGAAVVVNGLLTVNGVQLILGNYNLTLGASSPAVGGSNMAIVTNGTGSLRKIFSAPGSYTFPVADASAVMSYATLNFTSGTFGSNAYASVRVVSGKEPNMGGTTNYLNKYWAIDQSGITDFSCNITANYRNWVDIVPANTEGNLYAAGFANTSWSYYSPLASSVLTASGVTSFGNFTGLPMPCGYASNTQNGAVFTPTISILTNYVQQVSTSFTSKQYFVMNVIKGLTYQIYTTGTPNAQLEMVVYEEGNATGTPLANSLTNTGNPGSSNTNNVYLLFTSPLSGQIRVLINRQSDCSSAATTGLTVNTNVISSNNTQDNPAAAGTDSWIGHLYDTQNTATRFDNYLGYFLVPGFGGNPDTFQEMFGTTGSFPDGANDDNMTFNIYSNSSVRAKMLDANFAVRFRMNSTKRGFYRFDAASDDGIRLSVDGTSVYDHWDDHSPWVDSNMLLSLTGSSSLALEYYEQGGQNIVGFYNLVQIFSNTLSTNVSQALCKSTAGSAIGGDDFPATLPTNMSRGGYQWYYSTPSDPTRRMISGATSATYTPNASLAPFNNVVGVYYLYRRATINSTYNSTTLPTNATGNPYNASATNESNVATIRIKACPNYWIGGALPLSTTWNTSTDWNTSSNWSDGIPFPGDDVEFATTSNSGNGGADAKNNMVLDNSYTVGNFKNQSGKQAVINPNAALIVNNTITTSSADRIYIKSSSSQPNGSLIFQNAQSSPATATVEFYIKGVHSNTPAVANGVNYFYSWQFFGIPFRSGTASPSFDGYYVRSYDESKAVVNGKWTALTNSSVMNSFGGYEITQTSNTPTTVAIQGTLENNSTTIPLPYTTGAYDPGQHILSNPYTAAIDVRQLVFGANTEQTVYLYNTGSFASWYNNNGELTTTASSPGTYTAMPKSSAGTGSIPYDIPSMSGFLVKSTGALGSLTINYSSVITKNVNQQRAPQNRDSEAPKTTDKVYLAIALRGEYSGDNMWLINEQGTTHGYDNGWDGYKLSGFAGTPQLFAMEESGNYQISVSEDMNNTYLGFQAGVDLEDTLTFHSENLEKQYSGVYLIDLVEKKVVNITQSGSKYSFKSESTPSPVKRFKITTEPYIKDAQDLSSQIKLFNDNETVFVENLSNEKGELYVYDIMGRYLKKETFGPNSISSYSFPLTSGAYVIKAQSASEKVSKRIIVKHQGE